MTRKLLDVLRRPTVHRGLEVIAWPIHTAEIAHRDSGRRFRAESDLSRRSPAHPAQKPANTRGKAADLNEKARVRADSGLASGEEGIRTPDGDKPHTGFQDRRFRPLSHLTGRW